MDKIFSIQHDGDNSPDFSSSMETLSVTLSYVYRISIISDVIGYMRNYLFVMNLKWSEHKIVEFLKSPCDFHKSLVNGDKKLQITFEDGFYSLVLSQSIEVLYPDFF